MKSLSISVITPSYNQAAYLEQTILSVINQDFPSIEYIIVDGGSSDCSVDVIKRYASHISYWVSEKDKGQSDAINKGLRFATGDIVCWLNSDDLFEPNALNTIMQFFAKNPDAQFVYGDGVIFYEGGKKRDSYCQPGRVDREILSRCDPIQQPSTFWRRGVHEEIGYVDENLHYTMDWDFFMRVALRYEMHYLPGFFSRYRIHNAHKSGSGAERRSQEILEFIEKYASNNFIDMFRSVYPYAGDVRRFRGIFGWRFGRLAFYLRHPILVMAYGRSLRTALDMY